MDWWFWPALAIGVWWLISLIWPKANLGDLLTDGGQRMQALGWGLTLAVTVPILGLFFFGTIGLIVGVVIGLLFGVGLIGSAFKRKQAE